MARSRYKANPRILPQGAIIEFKKQGAYVKVSAVDPASLTEVSIVGDPRAGEATLSSLAVQKLERIVLKKHGAQPIRPRREDPPSGWDF